MAETREAVYGQSVPVDFTLWQTDGSALLTGAVHAAGDTVLVSDDLPEVPTTNGFEIKERGYVIALTADELEAQHIALYIIDQGAKTWLDKVIHIFTHSHPLAYDPRGVLAADTAQTGTASSITLAASESSTNDLFVGGVVEIIDGTGVGQAPRVISNYVGSTKVATVDPDWVITPAADSVYRIYSVPPSAGLALIRQNQARPNFTFLMTDSAGDGAPGLTVTAQRRLDAGAFAPCANAVVEDAAGGGVYAINLASSDTNGEIVTLKFTAAGAQDRVITILTKP